MCFHRDIIFITRLWRITREVHASLVEVGARNLIDWALRSRIKDTGKLDLIASLFGDISKFSLVI